MSDGWRVPVGEAARYRSDGSWLTGAEEVLARAARRSGEEARAVRESAPGTPNGLFLARAGDLTRAQWFLWAWAALADRKSTRLNSSHANISYAVFCLKKNPHVAYLRLSLAVL